ncbi:hypothetical protein E4U16_005407 [Claviceps sp. LM84 group G4]|nr:hypothetical protein E4U33_003684 [Claviceps sp. LM78 group G4]KAG6085436.1 hypothetical protein E4U16_005407 [Claviceps sp. LM84 group G4]
MSVLDDMRSHFDAVSEDGTVSEVFEDGTEAVEEIEYVDDEEFSHETLDLHLLSARDERYQAGMLPLAIGAETVHYASAIPSYPISPDKGHAYIIDTTQIDESDVKEPWNAVSKVSVLRHQHANIPRYNTVEKRGGNADITSSAFLSDEPVKLFHYECTGVKQCDHLDSALQTEDSPL